MKFDDYNYDPHNKYILVDPNIEESDVDIEGFVPAKINKNDAKKMDSFAGETKGPKLTVNVLSQSDSNDEFIHELFETKTENEILEDQHN